MNFAQKFISGEIDDVELIFDHIIQWHDSGYKVELHEFLGLTEEEHLEFVSSEDSFYKILREKRAMKRRNQFRLIKSA